jgi:hypothetical protein
VLRIVAERHGLRYAQSGRRSGYARKLSDYSSDTIDNAHWQALEARKTMDFDLGLGAEAAGGSAGNRVAKSEGISAHQNFVTSQTHLFFSFTVNFGLVSEKSSS